MKLLIPYLSLAAVVNAMSWSTTGKPHSRRNAANTIRSSNRHASLSRRQGVTSCSTTNPTKPKIFILSMFEYEANVWYPDTSLNLYATNITVPGASPLFPDAHCSVSGEVCQITLGEGEINAAASMTALWTSGCFDLTSTYFLIAAIAGGNPHLVTTGSVTLARFAVQLTLQYEFDRSQVPTNDSSGYFPQGANYPDEYSAQDYPGSIYGTEVFELNENLRDRFFAVAAQATLNDTDGAAAYRVAYPYAPANQPPSFVKCDSGTADDYWSGSVLGDAFSSYTLLLTNGSGIYCATQQEDNATLESLLRAAIAGKVDFSRIALMRTISDFDRAPPTEDEVFHLLYADQGGFLPSIENIYFAGIQIVDDVLAHWNDIYATGLRPGNYIGDLFNSLPGIVSPDIGTVDVYIN